MNNKVKFNNPIKAQILRKTGEVIDVEIVENGVVDEGFNYLLGTSFRAVSQIGLWYIGLIQGEGAGVPVLDDADTMASHAWTENVAYDEATREVWTPVVVTDQSVANTVTADFTFNAAAEIRGIFIPSSSTKSGSTGTLWATALFNANMDFVDDDVLRIIYTVSAS